MSLSTPLTPLDKDYPFANVLVAELVADLQLLLSGVVPEENIARLSRHVSIVELKQFPSQGQFRISYFSHPEITDGQEMAYTTQHFNDEVAATLKSRAEGSSPAVSNLRTQGGLQFKATDPAAAYWLKQVAAAQLAEDRHPEIVHA